MEKAESQIEITQEIEVAAKGLRNPITVCEVTGVQGERNCQLINLEQDKLMKLEEKIIFNMYPIEDKFIMEHS